MRSLREVSDAEVRRVMRRIEKLSVGQQCRLHREVCRLVEPFYREAYKEKREAHWRVSQGL